MEQREWHPEDGRVAGTGTFQQIGPDQQRAAQDVLAREAETARRMKSHLWVVIVTHRASTQVLDSIDAQQDGDSGPALLDTETMLGAPSIGCYVCERGYERILRHRKCPGDPGGPM